MKMTTKVSIFLILGFVFFISCHEDNLLNKEKDLDRELIHEAQDYFEGIISAAAINGTLVKDKGWSPGEVVPEWKEAYVKKGNNYDFVFVPIYTQKEYVVRYKRYKENGNEYYSRCRVSQILCIRKSSDGVLSAAYMTLVPTLDYYNRNRNKVATQYIKHPNFHSNFSGRVIYNDVVSFRMMAVDKVERGKFEWGISTKNAKDLETFTAQSEELFENITLFGGIRTRGTVPGGELEEVVYIFCTTCLRTVEADHYCDFPWWFFEDWLWGGNNWGNDWGDDWGNNGDDDNGGGGSAGGGYVPPLGGNNNGGGNGNTPTNKLNPKVDIPKRLKVQAENTKKCIPFCLFYALKISGENTKLRHVVRDFRNDFGIKFLKEGVTFNQLNSYLEEYYNTGNDTTWRGNVDAGYFVVVGVPEGEIYHAVLLVGYTSDGYLITLDPLTGKQRIVHPGTVAGTSTPFSDKK